MNVWLLAFTSAGERVLGPFTSVAITDTGITDTLTGETIATRSTARPHDQTIVTMGGAYVVARRIVVQQGGWESPWGERGK